MYNHRNHIGMFLVVAAGMCSLMLPACARTVSAATELKVFKSDAGTFEVKLPGVPEETSENMDAPAGPTVLHSFKLSDSSGFYLVTYSDYPVELDVAKSLSDVVNAQMKSLGDDVTLAADKSVTVNGRSGRRVRIESKDFVFLNLVVISGHRLYQVIFGVSQGTPVPPEANEFLDSFHIH